MLYEVITRSQIARTATRSFVAVKKRRPKRPSAAASMSKPNPGVVGSVNQVLFSEGTSAPTWRNITAGSTGLSFGLAGSAWALSGTLAVASGGVITSYSIHYTKLYDAF